MSIDGRLSQRNRSVTKIVEGMIPQNIDIRYCKIDTRGE